MTFRRLIFPFLFVLAVTTGAAAQEKAVDLGMERRQLLPGSSIEIQQAGRPRVALALSGGGARGFAQIGVLKVLEENSIPVDAIAGTSIGAIIGGLYSVGYTAAEIESLATSVSWDETISDVPRRDQLFLTQKEENSSPLLRLRFRGMRLAMASGYSSGYYLTALLTRLLINAPAAPRNDFRALPIPIRVVCSDLLSGRRIMLETGSLIQAIRASMAIPLLFTPVHVDSLLLVDGGLVQNLPVAEARSTGADMVIALDTSSKLRNGRQLDAPWKIADQVTTIMQQEKLENELARADIAIVPSLSGIANTDFHRITDIIASGEAAARAALPRIERMLTHLSQPRDTSYQIEELTYRGFNRISPEAIFPQPPLDLRFPIPEAEILWAGQRLSQSGLFQRVEAFYDSLNSRLIFSVVENPVIREVRLQGNTLYPDSLLLEGTRSWRDKVCNSGRISAWVRDIVSRYHRNGWGLAHVDTLRLEDGVLYAGIDEGMIKQIRIAGAGRTKPYVILRELGLREGEVFRNETAIEGLNNIYSTGFFSTVYYDFPDRLNDHCLTIRVEEKENALMLMGARYDLERRGKGFLSLIRDNIFGIGAQGSLQGVAGKRDLSLSAALESSRFLYSYLTYKIDFSLAREEQYYYEDYQQVGGYTQYGRWLGVEVGQQIKRLGTLSLQLGWQQINLVPTSGETTPKERFSLVRFTLRSEVDTRDRYPFPRRGKWHILEYETAGQWLGSEVSYARIFSSMESYIPLSASFNFHPRIQWGTADMTTPFVRQFHLGGMDTFSALPQQSLTGRRFILAGSELRYQMPQLGLLTTYVSLRYEVAGIWGRYTRIQLSDFHHCLDLRLSLETPLGPVTAGLGLMDGWRKRLVFAAGYSF